MQVIFKQLSTLLLLLLPIALFAHDHAGGGFVAGISHPVLGLDHLLAMLSVGILSSQIGGKAIWVVPAVFVAAMSGGGIAGIGSENLPFIETGIAFSVVVLGIAIAFEQKLPLVVTLLFVSVFGFFHGYAHGVEMPSIANPYMYASGFLLGTSGIHLVGVAIGVVGTKTPNSSTVLRYAGAFVAGMGATMLVG